MPHEGRTMEDIADKFEQRWDGEKYTDGQKRAMRNWKKFVINPKEPKTYVNRQSFERRLEVDHMVDELNEQRGLKEIWDE